MLVEATAGYGFVRLMDPLVNRGFVNPERQMAIFLPLAIVGLFVMRSLATFVVDYGMARTGRSVVRDLREEVLSKYLRLPSAHFDTEPTPVMVSRLNFDTEQVTQASADALKTIVADSLTILYMVVLMLQMSVKVTLALLVIAPLIGVIVSFVASATAASAAASRTAWARWRKARSSRSRRSRTSRCTAPRPWRPPVTRCSPTASSA